MSSVPSTQSLEVLMQLISPGRRYQVPPSLVDWNEIDHLARHSHVTAALWQRLRNDPLLATMPPHMVIDLRRTFHEGVRRNWLLKSQFADIVRMLNQQGQVPMLLKGAAYLFDPPSGDISRRYLHDLDLFANDPDACQEAMLRSGFEQHEKYVPGWHHHLPALVEPRTGLEVEVHRRPFQTADDAMTELFTACAEHHYKDGVCFQLPSRACRIVMNVVHAQVSDKSFAFGLFNPRYLLEFAEFALAWPSDDWVFAEAMLKGNDIVYGNYRHLVSELMGIEPPVRRVPRRIDRLHVARVRRRQLVLEKRKWWQGALSWPLRLKDLARRSAGKWIGWRSVPSDLLDNARRRS